MKKFVFLYYGFEQPTPEIMDAWSGWFASVGDKFVDSGNPLGSGRQVSKARETRELEMGEGPVGYSIVSAATIDEALSLLEGCPIIEHVQVFEAMSM